MLRDIFDGTTYEIPTRPSGQPVDSTNLGRHKFFEKEFHLADCIQGVPKETLITMIEVAALSETASSWSAQLFEVCQEAWGRFFGADPPTKFHS